MTKNIKRNNDSNITKNLNSFFSLNLKLLKIFFIILIISGCSTVKQINDLQTYANVTFRHLCETSVRLDSISFAGFMRIKGVNGIPPVFIPFEIRSNLKEKNATLILSLRNQKILQIIIDQNNYYIVNNKENKFFKDSITNMNFTSVMGMSFDPIQIIYLMYGKLPLSESIELMNISQETSGYMLTMSDSTTLYSLVLDEEDNILSGSVDNQFHDKIIIESITYTKNDNNQSIPRSAVFSNSDLSVSITFMINALSDRPLTGDYMDLNTLTTMEQVSTPQEVAIRM